MTQPVFLWWGMCKVSTELSPWNCRIKCVRICELSWRVGCKSCSADLENTNYLTRRITIWFLKDSGTYCTSNLYPVSSNKGLFNSEEHCWYEHYIFCLYRAAGVWLTLEKIHFSLRTIADKQLLYCDCTSIKKSVKPRTDCLFYGSEQPIFSLWGICRTFTWLI